MEGQELQQTGEPTKPEFLYHYTTESGLDGILSSDCIWATDYRFLNDEAERKLGLELYKATINKIALEHFGTLNYANTLVEHFQRSCSDVLDAFIVSFCASFAKDDYQEEQPVEDGRGGDRLSQWRGYARGSQGYCLAFDFGLLHRIQQEPQNRNCCYFGFCTYLEDSIDAMIEAHVREVFGSLVLQLAKEDFLDFESLHNALNENEPKHDAMLTFLVDVLLLCGIFKHVGFQEEHEYRLIKFLFRSKPNRDELHFRNGLFKNTPYIKIPLSLSSESSPLKAIVVGPSANKDQNAYGLKIRLREMGITSVEVVPSKIPYRNW